jgi:hypothetical protein
MFDTGNTGRLGALKVSVTILGLVPISSGLFSASLCLLDAIFLSLENKSRPVGNETLLTPREACFWTVPTSSSDIDLSSAPPGRGTGDIVRCGNTHGLLISPTHSSPIIGPFTSIPRIRRPRTLNISIVPTFVPIAMSVCTPPTTSSRPSLHLGPTDRQVGSPLTCHVLSTFPPSDSKSTSRHRPSCPILTILDLWPGKNSAAITPRIAGLCNFLTTPTLTG